MLDNSSKQELYTLVSELLTVVYECKVTTGGSSNERLSTSIMCLPAQSKNNSCSVLNKPTLNQV